MNQRAIGGWGFVIAGIVFLVVGAVPILKGEAGKPSLLVLAIAFLIIGAGIARRAAGNDTQPKA